MNKLYVTAIKYSDDDSHIGEVLAHSVSYERGRLKKGTQLSRAKVISLLKSGQEFKTAVYNYSTGKWNNGADIGIVKIAGREYLRTTPDSTERDNLGHLLLIDEIR